MASGGEGEEGGSRRRSSRKSKGVWTASKKEGVWLARLLLLEEGDDDRCVACFIYQLSDRHQPACH